MNVRHPTGVSLAECHRISLISYSGRRVFPTRRLACSVEDNWVTCPISPVPESARPAARVPEASTCRLHAVRRHHCLGSGQAEFHDMMHVTPVVNEAVSTPCFAGWAHPWSPVERPLATPARCGTHLAELTISECRARSKWYGRFPAALATRLAVSTSHVF